ncbi:MAG: DUF3320 domain-containing protein [Limisphaerales bacterium]
MAMTTQELLERGRKELLDLSSRNRLLSIPVRSKSARVIHIYDELSDQVFRLLVSEKKTLSFLPGRRGVKDSDGAEMALEEEEDTAGDEVSSLAQPEDDEAEEGGVARRHVDARLQTMLSPEGLQRRLLGLYRDALTLEEEQGVNVLYLALGQLKWCETDKADSGRWAPLLLVPVSLHRRSASEKLVLRWREEDVEDNLSLRAKLKHDFGVELPEFEDADGEGSVVAPYFEEVAAVVAKMPNWEVKPNAMTLGFFSFAKFLMYRDLDPETWPEADGLLDHPLITGLLQDGFPHGDNLLAEDCDLDKQIPAARLDHVVDADSSQTLAIEAVRQGRNVVIQGPPGTGKSQSITNIISTAVLAGKKVLFVAEKLAALQVVKRRLGREGLGDLCLELHSNKANKRAVLQELDRTWNLGRPKSQLLETLIGRLEKQRDRLNGHVESLHTPHTPSNLTPFTIMGELVLLEDRGRLVPEVVMDGAEKWSAEDVDERRMLMVDLAGKLERIGIPWQHPWCGCGRRTVLNIDLGPIGELVKTTGAAVSRVKVASAKLAALLDQPEPGTLREVQDQKTIAGFVTSAPPADRTAICSVAWNGNLEELQALLDAGRECAAVLEELNDRVTEQTWEQDFSEVRSHIAAHGQSLFRFFNGKYRNALAQLRGCLKQELPASHTDRVALVDKIVAGQRTLKSLRSRRELGQSAWGTAWRDEKTDWSAAASVLEWVAAHRAAGLDDAFRRMVARLEDRPAIAAALEELTAGVEAVAAFYAQLGQTLVLDVQQAFGVASLEEVDLEVLRQRSVVWQEHPEALSVWTLYHASSQKARELGLTPLVERIHTGTLAGSMLAEAFERAYFSKLLREVMRLNPELSSFDGNLHERHIEAFKDMDRERLALAKLFTLRAHHEGMPPTGSAVGAAGIVKSEIQRKRGHRPVRRLLKEAGTVVQSIKPVFMMSPLSVAQFLAPGAVQFDLLVIDEASQVQPIDALGAIARCRQIVVVGDSKQLPPTRFFARLTSESDEDEEEDEPTAAKASDMESILGLCEARGLPQSMLRWHYRSRHQSLIAVSNREFYDNRLFIVPSPHMQVDGLGLQFVHITDGVFDSGASGTNRKEAQAIGRAILRHARESAGLTLGVAAFSVRQQKAILDELEVLRRENPDTEEFFNSHPDEPFFVKNLENVQGDERDVIFISVGYGRNKSGYMAMRFGPLSNEGGERRLNVLISRAKRRCVVFSSITADDIDLNRATGLGVAAFKTFLSFAQTGRLEIARSTGGEEQSPFEEAVRRSLESLGHTVHTQVGLAGFFIDLAIVDPERPGRYLLGIECDGASYHSSRSARERDRLRQAVLEDHGWLIHRIWSTDWFQRPKEQLARVQEAIEAARTGLAAHGSEGQAQAASCPANDCTIEREEEINLREGFAGIAVPYVESSFAVRTSQDIHETPIGQLAQVVLKIVRQEGPVHTEIVVARVRDLWGAGRAGSRIQDAVQQAIRSVVASRECLLEEGCLLLEGALLLVRSRENVTLRALAKPEFIPPQEIRAAIMQLVKEHHGASPEEIPLAVSRMLGIQRTSPQMRNVLEQQLARLIESRDLVHESGMLRLPQDAQSAAN